MTLVSAQSFNACTVSYVTSSASTSTSSSGQTICRCLDKVRESTVHFIISRDNLLMSIYIEHFTYNIVAILLRYLLIVDRTLRRVSLYPDLGWTTFFVAQVPNIPVLWVSECIVRLVYM